eukprot:1033292-Lingulodinium_polyedra.AAC.1
MVGVVRWRFGCVSSGTRCICVQLPAVAVPVAVHDTMYCTTGRVPPCSNAGAPACGFKASLNTSKMLCEANGFFTTSVLDPPSASGTKMHSVNCPTRLCRSGQSHARALPSVSAKHRSATRGLKSSPVAALNHILPKRAASTTSSGASTGSAAGKGACSARMSATGIGAHLLGFPVTSGTWAAYWTARSRTDSTASRSELYFRPTTFLDPRPHAFERLTRALSSGKLMWGDVLTWILIMELTDSISSVSQRHTRASSRNICHKHRSMQPEAAVFSISHANCSLILRPLNSKLDEGVASSSLATSCRLAHGVSGHPLASHNSLYGSRSKRLPIRREKSACAPKTADWMMPGSLSCIPGSACRMMSAHFSWSIMSSYKRA